MIFFMLNDLYFNQI